MPGETDLQRQAGEAGSCGLACLSGRNEFVASVLGFVGWLRLVLNAGRAPIGRAS